MNRRKLGKFGLAGTAALLGSFLFPKDTSPAIAASRETTAPKETLRGDSSPIGLIVREVYSETLGKSMAGVYLTSPVPISQVGPIKVLYRDGGKAWAATEGRGALPWQVLEAQPVTRTLASGQDTYGYFVALLGGEGVEEYPPGHVDDTSFFKGSGGNPIIWPKIRTVAGIAGPLDVEVIFVNRDANFHLVADTLHLPERAPLTAQDYRRTFYAGVAGDGET